MRLTGLHLLLTHECNYECDHCFVWGGPRQTGTLTLARVDRILAQADELGSIEWIYYEGGEPFLYYPVLVLGVRQALQRGFHVGVVTNGYWATSEDDARTWLAPFAGCLDDLSVSRDAYHGDEAHDRLVANARAAARALDIPMGEICIAPPAAAGASDAVGQIPAGDASAVMYRGRAATKLAGAAPGRPWTSFDHCPHEDLREPGRVHVDPLGNVHLCQGISLGNVFSTTLREISARYDPDAHPIAGPLLRGGPAALVRDYGLDHAAMYADECHLCDAARRALRARFPEILAPDQMYGVADGA